MRETSPQSSAPPIPTESAAESTTEPAAPVPPHRSVARRLYDWVLSWADTPYGTLALFCISFAESSFFPLPPDILQIALTAGKPRRAFFYATVSLVASVLGAVLGYYIGAVFWDVSQNFFYHYVPGVTEGLVDVVKAKYNENAFFAIWAAAFTIIPFKIFTITAGITHVPLATLIFASVIGRGMRFFAVAMLLWLFGPDIKTWIERYFDWIAVLFCIVFVGGFVLIKLLMM